MYYPLIFTSGPSGASTTQPKLPTASPPWSQQEGDNDQGDLQDSNNKEIEEVYLKSKDEVDEEAHSDSNDGEYQDDRVESDHEVIEDGSSTSGSEVIEVARPQTPNRIKSGTMKGNQVPLKRFVLFVSFISVLILL
jgi:hypothetical protein